MLLMLLTESVSSKDHDITLKMNCLIFLRFTLCFGRRLAGALNS